MFKKALHEMRQDKRIRKLAWSIVVIILTFFVHYVTELARELSPLIVLILREFVKYINVEHLGDLGVDKEEDFN